MQRKTLISALVLTGMVAAPSAFAGGDYKEKDQAQSERQQSEDSQAAFNTETNESPGTRMENAGRSTPNQNTTDLNSSPGARMGSATRDSEESRTVTINENEDESNLSSTEDRSDEVSRTTPSREDEESRAAATTSESKPKKDSATKRHDSGGAALMNKPADSSERSGSNAADRSGSASASENEGTMRSADLTEGKGLTAQDQSNKEADVEVTRQIRQGLMDRELSTSARNVKIITRDGTVTLKGNVASAAEKQTVKDVAKSKAGQMTVKDELVIRE